MPISTYVVFDATGLEEITLIIEQKGPRIMRKRGKNRKGTEEGRQRGTHVKFRL